MGWGNGIPHHRLISCHKSAHGGISVAFLWPCSAPLWPVFAALQASSWASGTGLGFEGSARQTTGNFVLRVLDAPFGRTPGSRRAVTCQRWWRQYSPHLQRGKNSRIITFPGNDLQGRTSRRALIQKQRKTRPGMRMLPEAACTPRVLEGLPNLSTLVKVRFCELR